MLGFARDDRTSPRPVRQASPLIAFLVLACFFISGAGGLVYEVVCSRLLVRVFGATLLSNATVLTVFMVGLAAGAYLSGRFLSSRWHPLKIYACLEGLVGLCGIALSLAFSQKAIAWLWPVLFQASGHDPLLMQAARFLACAVVLIIPTSLMGATLPVLSRFAAHNDRDPRAAVNYLYAANTAGAVFGTIASGFILIPAFGLTASLLVAAAFNILVAAVSLVLARRQPEAGGALTSDSADQTLSITALPEADSNAGGNHSDENDRMVPAVMVVMLLSGLLSMTLQVVWMRFFSLMLGSSTYAFSCVLSIFLLGLAGGSWLGTRFRMHLRPALTAMGLLLLAAGTFIYLSLFLLSAVPQLLVSIENNLYGFGGGYSFALMLAARAMVAALVILPSALLVGALFPLAVNEVVGEPAAAAARVGRLYALNTLGAIAGAWLSGFVIIPLLARLFLSGIQTTLVLVACAEIGLGATLLTLRQVRRQGGLSSGVRMVSVPAALFALPSLCFFALKPAWDTSSMSTGVSFFSDSELKMSGGSTPSTVLFYEEGLNTTVTVCEQPRANVRYLKNDGKVDVSVPADPRQPSPACDLVTQVLLGQIPALIHRGPMSNVLLIGYGSGTTAGSILQSPAVANLTIAELEKSVIRCDRFFNQVNNNPLAEGLLSSGKVKLTEEDGRNLLSTVQNKYDLVVAQPADPWVAGSGDLFTEEFWQLGKSRLKENGLFCQWIQLYGITPEYLAVLCRTFQRVFPETIVFHPNGAGEIILIGFEDEAKIDLPSFSKKFIQPAVRKDLMRISLRSPSDVLNLIAQGPSELRAFCNEIGCKTKDHRVSTDDNLLLEYELPKQLVRAASLLEGNLAALKAVPANRALLLSGNLLPARDDSSNQAAEKLLNKESFSGAVALLRKAAAADPLDVRALSLLGYAYLKLNDLPEAERYLRSALELDPNQFMPRFNLAKVLFRTGRDTDGLRELSIASAGKPNSAAPLLLATVYFMRTNKWSLAQSNFDLLESRAGADPRYDLLAYEIFRHNDKGGEAFARLKCYRKAIGRDLGEAEVPAVLEQVFKETDLIP